MVSAKGASRWIGIDFEDCEGVILNRESGWESGAGENKNYS